MAGAAGAPAGAEVVGMNAVDGKTVNRVVIGHLSMPPAGFLELYNQMTGVVQRLTKAGKARQVEKPSQQPS